VGAWGGGLILLMKFILTLVIYNFQLQRALMAVPRALGPLQLLNGKFALDLINARVPKTGDKSDYLEPPIIIIVIINLEHPPLLIIIIIIIMIIIMIIINIIISGSSSIIRSMRIIMVAIIKWERLLDESCWKRKKRREWGIIL
jgi:hypothetical protein